MQSALFVCELESLKISTSLPAFIKCNKAGLIRTLWRHHAKKPKVAKRLPPCNNFYVHSSSIIYFHVVTFFLLQKCHIYSYLGCSPGE